MFREKFKLIFQPGSLYGVWAMFADLIIGPGFPQDIISLLLLLTAITILRLASVFGGWSLPNRTL